MMKLIYALLLSSLILPRFAQAQHAKLKIREPEEHLSSIGFSSAIQTTLCSGLVRPNYSQASWLTNIKHVGNKQGYSKQIDSIKAIKTKLKRNKSNIVSVEDSIPIFSNNLSVATNFQGNIFNGGAPPDNTLAISDNGTIVSAINCNVAYYSNTGSQLWTGSFWDLFNDPSLTELIFDPIVMYDAQADRFIMLCIHGFSSSTSKLILCFSKSNNPLDGWWTYKLSGNPLNNGCWLDYPKLGISNNEVFVTGNLFDDITGFSEPVIYQITKSNGLTGTNLNWMLWSNIAGSPITIIPASYGQQGNYGPGLYFVHQSPGSGNAIDLYEITNDLNANPQLVKNTIFKADYEPSGDADQSGSSVKLITGDCRISNAFYLNGEIHYVFQEDYQNTNYTGINYNRLNVNTLTNTSFSYGEPGFDCAYPAVASFATSATDKTVVINYLRSGSSIFPETRSIVFNNNQTWSNSQVIKAGENFVDAFDLGGSVRWGDYTGIAYKQNAASPEVWVSGCYGSSQMLFNTTYNCFNTWIAQLKNFMVSTSNLSEEKSHNLTVFPNPIIQLFSLDFVLDQQRSTKISIQAMDGSLCHTLFHGLLKKGKQVLTFNRNALSKGLYLLTVVSENRTLFSTKIVVE